MKQPDFTKPIDILAWLYNEWGACGCSDYQDIVEVIYIYLKWAAKTTEPRSPYHEAFPDKGIFYIVMGRLDSLDLVEHGTAIRHPWITDKGRILLKTLKETAWDLFDKVSGEAYDGLTYGE